MIPQNVESESPQFFLRGVSPFVLLIVYCALSIALMVLDYRLHYLQPLRQVLFSVLKPINDFASTPAILFETTKIWFADSAKLHDELLTLRQRVQDNEFKLLDYNNLHRENTQLRQLLNFEKKQPLKGLYSEVIYESRDPYTRKVFLNKGQRNGIRRGQVVISAHGLLGQIVDLFQDASALQLITSPNAVTAVLNERTGLRYIVRGQSHERLKLQYIQSTEQVKVGDVLSTYGLDGRHPRGVPVAVVQSITRQNNRDYFDVECRPIASVSTFTEAIILSNSNWVPTLPPSKP